MNDFMPEPTGGGRVAEVCGFQSHHSNVLLDDGAALTGAVAEPVFDRDAKLATLKSLAASKGLPLSATLAVGDGANDLAMIGAAGLGVAYRAKLVVIPANGHFRRHRLQFAGSEARLVNQMELVLEQPVPSVGRPTVAPSQACIALGGVPVEALVGRDGRVEADQHLADDVICVVSAEFRLANSRVEKRRHGNLCCHHRAGKSHPKFLDQALDGLAAWEFHHESKAGHADVVDLRQPIQGDFHPDASAFDEGFQGSHAQHLARLVCTRKIKDVHEHCKACSAGRPCRPSVEVD